MYLLTNFWTQSAVGTNQIHFWIANLITLIVGYIFGHFLFGKFVVIIWHFDINKKYSKSYGATNVARIGGIQLGITAFFFDVAKTVIVCYFFLILKLYVNYFSVCIILIAGLGAMLGHCLPILFKFKGGKGLSCFWGILLVFNPWLGIIVIAVYILIVLFVKNSIFAFLASIPLTVGCLFAPLIGKEYLQKFYANSGQICSCVPEWIVIASCILTVIFHRKNLLALFYKRSNQNVNPFSLSSLKTSFLNRNK